MPRLTLDGQGVEVPAGSTVLEAARRLGLEIPTLCHLPGEQPLTSCMVCAVKDTLTGRLLPACSAPAVDGMVLETATAEIRTHRQRVLELLLDEHAGDCEAPCRMTCPAQLDAPRLLRQVAAGMLESALVTARAAIAMPGVIGHVCPAPCEKACRRGKHDAPLSICALERYVAGWGLAQGARLDPSPAPASGKRVAVIGAGPAGLAAAFFLLCRGHACTIFDDHEEPGGQLRYRSSHKPVPFPVLDAEIALVRRLGAAFRMKTRIEPGKGLARLKAGHDAVVLAPGRFASATLSDWGLATDDRGIKANGVSLQTSDPAVFAGGEAIHPGRMAVRAMAHGKTIAVAIDHYLGGGVAAGDKPRFNSRLGALKPVETRELLKEADLAERQPAEGSAGLSPGQAVAESRRCLHCDCRKAGSCGLRKLAEQYGARQGSVTAPMRPAFSRNITHPAVIFEPGKCIKCGICVQLTSSARGKSGLAFIGHGYETVVAAPLGESLEVALGDKADACVGLCPTGALAWKNS